MFPPATNVKLQWNEPWLFKLRTHGKVAWAIRFAVFAGFTSLFALGIAYDSRSSSGRAFTTAQKIVLPLVIGATFVALVELPTLQRLASVTEHTIECVGMFGMMASPLLWPLAAGCWNRKEISYVQLLRPGEDTNRFGHGLMIIVLKYTRPALVGVGRTVSLEQLADALHTMGVQVTLSGWQPSPAAGEAKSEDLT